MLRALGDSIDEARLQALVAMTDLDGSGAIDFQEFTGLMLRRQRELEREGAPPLRATRVHRLLAAAHAGRAELWLAPPPRGGARDVARERWWLLGVIDHLWGAQVHAQRARLRGLRGARGAERRNAVKLACDRQLTFAGRQQPLCQLAERLFLS